MNTLQNTHQHVDTVAKDFGLAVVVVSLSANLTLFVTWLTTSVSA